MNTQTNNDNETNSDSSADETTRRQTIEQLSEMVIDNEIALLITCGSDHVIRSRPMVNFNNRFDGDLYFLTESNGDVPRSLQANSRCNVSISEPGKGRYASITGTAEVSNDAKKAELLWTDSCSRWFGMEQPDDSILVIKVDVDDAEYWDQDTSMTYRLKRFVSSIAGSDSQEMDVAHEKVDWNIDSIQSQRPTAKRTENITPLSVVRPGE